MRSKVAVGSALALVFSLGLLGGIVVERNVENDEEVQPRASAPVGVSQVIGYYNGVPAFAAWLRKQPTVQKRGTGYRANNVVTWPWPDRLERTLLILVHDHDAAQSTPPPTPTPTPTTPTQTLAPRTYNKVLPSGSDARFCTAGLPRGDDGNFRDGVGIYDEKGLDQSGRRSADTQVEGLRLANNMNGAEACTGYTEAGRTFPPWPAGSYQP